MYYITSFKKNKITKLSQLDQLLSFGKTLGVKRYETTTMLTTTIRPNPDILAKLANLQAQLLTLNGLYPEHEKHMHFDVFEIPKASGGTRTIKAPKENLKQAYSSVAEYLGRELKFLAHNNAYAYIPSRSTKDAIVRHQENKSEWFLKLDISKFFDNCNTQMIEKMLLKVYPVCLDPTLCRELAKFATWENQLPQGTPLSPILTNMIMVPFDTHTSDFLNRQGFVYTRYADDLLISHQKPFQFAGIISRIENVFKSLELPFQIKREKTRYGNRNGRNWNLGLMLNKENKITLGHKLKKQLKIILFQTATGSLPANDPHNIGLFAYLKQIEPEYYSMLNKYSVEKYHRGIKQIINPN